MNHQLNDAVIFQSCDNRIEICGGIASGKTTLADLISSLNVKPLFENFRTNLFWKEFFADPAKFAFETEISFMLQHYHEIKKQVSGTVFVCDYSFSLDIAYAEIGLKGSQLNAFLTVYEEIKKELPPPALLIHLQCDANTELDRIRKRARQEENAITLDFLNSLNKAVESQVEKIRGNIKVIQIDSAAKNFVADEIVKQEIVELVTQHIKAA